MTNLLCKLIPEKILVLILYSAMYYPVMWFDLCILYLGWLIGNMVFYKFEMHVPIWKRLFKIVAMSSVLIFIHTHLGREWFYGVLVVMLLGIIFLHGYLLPKKGINGLTAEPYEKYLAEVRKIKKKV